MINFSCVLGKDEADGGQYWGEGPSFKGEWIPRKWPSFKGQDLRHFPSCKGKGPTEYSSLLILYEFIFMLHLLISDIIHVVYIFNCE